MNTSLCDGLSGNTGMGIYIVVTWNTDKQKHEPQTYKYTLLW